VTLTAFAGALLAIAIPGWTLLARRAWCAEQRSRLCARGPKVIWVNDAEKVPWALWGADHGFFEVEWAYRMPYLRAAAALE
jgi:hypothetical protein